MNAGRPKGSGRSLYSVPLYSGFAVHQRGGWFSVLQPHAGSAGISLVLVGPAGEFSSAPEVGPLGLRVLCFTSCPLSPDPPLPSRSQGLPRSQGTGGAWPLLEMRGELMS